MTLFKNIQDCFFRLSNKRPQSELAKKIEAIILSGSLTQTTDSYIESTNPFKAFVITGTVNSGPDSISFFLATKGFMPEYELKSLYLNLEKVETELPNWERVYLKDKLITAILKQLKNEAQIA